jgi:hypothetical protein
LARQRTELVPNVQVTIQPILIDKGDKWMIAFIQKAFNHGLLRAPLAQVGG